MIIERAATKCIRTVDHLIKRWISLKSLGFPLLLLVLFNFSDVLLTSIFQGLHLVFEVVGFILERQLEKIFDLTPRQAQSTMAYTAFAVGLLVSVSLWRKLRRTVRRALQPDSALNQRIGQWFNTALNQTDWRAIAITLSLFGVTLFLFT